MPVDWKQVLDVAPDWATTSLTLSELEGIFDAIGDPNAAAAFRSIRGEERTVLEAAVGQLQPFRAKLRYKLRKAKVLPALTPAEASEWGEHATAEAIRLGYTTRDEVEAYLQRAGRG